MVKIYIMNNCYSCNNLLEKNNFSIEHIIPNSIGGKLKSSKLLCKSCNSILGSEIDDKLAKQFNFFMNFFMLERERGSYQPIKGKTKNGEEYSLNGIEIKSKPKILLDDESVNFTGNDEEDLKIYFKGLLKKYPHLKMEDIILHAKKERYYLNEPISIKLSIGGENVFRAISKMAVNFYMHKGGNRNNITNILSYIKGEVNNEPKKIFHHYGFSDDNLIINDQKLYHLIKIIGNSEEKTLYSYIELFGTFKFIIYLSDNYEGQNIDYQLFYNLFSKAQIKNPITINYKRCEILQILNNSDNQYFISNIQKNIQRTMNIAQKIQSDKVVGNLIKESVEKIFGRNENQGKKVSESLIEEFVNDISYLMAVYMSRNKDEGQTHF